MWRWIIDCVLKLLNKKAISESPQASISKKVKFENIDMKMICLFILKLKFEFFELGNGLLKQIKLMLL